MSLANQKATERLFIQEPVESSVPGRASMVSCASDIRDDELIGDELLADIADFVDCDCRRVDDQPWRLRDRRYAADIGLRAADQHTIAQSDR